MSLGFQSVNGFLKSPTGDSDLPLLRAIAFDAIFIRLSQKKLETRMSQSPLFRCGNSSLRESRFAMLMNKCSVANLLANIYAH